MQKLIGENLGSDLSSLVNFELEYGEGDQGELRLYVKEELPQESISKLETELITKGVTLTEPIKQVARVVIIAFEKRIAPLLIIGGIVIAIVGSILGWQLFKTVEAGVPLWAWITSGAILLYLIVRR